MGAQMRLVRGKRFVDAGAWWAEYDSLMARKRVLHRELLFDVPPLPTVPE